MKTFLLLLFITVLTSSLSLSAQTNGSIGYNYRDGPTISMEKRMFYSYDLAKTNGRIRITKHSVSLGFSWREVYKSKWGVLMTFGIRDNFWDMPLGISYSISRKLDIDFEINTLHLMFYEPLNNNITMSLTIKEF